MGLVFTPIIGERLEGGLSRSSRASGNPGLHARRLGDDSARLRRAFPLHPHFLSLLAGRGGRGDSACHRSRSVERMDEDFSARRRPSSFVMPGLDPGHPAPAANERKRPWIAGSSPATTRRDRPRPASHRAPVFLYVSPLARLRARDGAGEQRVHERLRLGRAADREVPGAPAPVRAGDRARGANARRFCEGGRVGLAPKRDPNS
jgi:hypothetical protein